MKPFGQSDERICRSCPGLWDIVLVLVLLVVPALYPILAKPLLYQDGLVGGQGGQLWSGVLMVSSCVIPPGIIAVYITRLVILASLLRRTWSWFAWRFLVLILAVFLVPVGLEVSRAIAWREGHPFLLGFRDRVTSQFDLDSLRGWARDLRNEPIGMVSKDRWPQVVKTLDPAEVDVDGRGKLTLIWGGGFQRWGVVVAADNTAECLEARSHINIGGGVYVWQAE